MCERKVVDLNKIKQDQNNMLPMRGFIVFQQYIENIENSVLNLIFELFEGCFLLFCFYLVLEFFVVHFLLKRNSNELLSIITMDLIILYFKYQYWVYIN
jgi:hypothetical protein